MKLPAFKLKATDGATLSLTDFKKQITVLYFYPKDNTPGCTTEGQDFSKLKANFGKLGVRVIGVSRDTVESHEKFRDQRKLSIDLISDPDDELANALDVIKMKNMYGKKFKGIERSTFVVDEKGKVVQEWRKVKVAGHAQDVLDFVKKYRKDNP